MKKFTICLLLCLFSIGILKAQTLKIQDAPDWFFNPPSEEYVGVSVPLENQKLAQQQAVYAALLSYVVRNDWKIDFAFRSSSDYVENSINGTSMSRLQTAYTYIFSLPSDYQIVKTTVNQYGEVFVSLKVIEKSNNSIQVKGVGDWFSQNKPLSEKSNVYFFLVDSSSCDEVKEFFYYEETHFGKTGVVATTTFESPRSLAREQFTSEQKYFYEPSQKHMYTKVGPRISNLLGSCSARLSLGAAYSSILINYIIQDALSILSTTEIKGYVVSDTLETTGAELNKFYAVHESICQDTITKPAKKIMLKTNGVELYLMLDDSDNSLFQSKNISKIQ
jgi:hypothetical protein